MEEDEEEVEEREGEVMKQSEVADPPAGQRANRDRREMPGITKEERGKGEGICEDTITE